MFHTTRSTAARTAKPGMLWLPKAVWTAFWLVFLLHAHGAALANQPASITVVMDDNYPPYVFRTTDGNVHGYLIDSWDLWSRQTKIVTRIVATDWDKAQRIMLEGGADVIDTIFYTAERSRLYDFGKAYASLAVPVFHHKDLSGIVDAASLKGLSVAVKAGDACIGVLRGLGVENLREYGSYEDIIRAAARSEVKVFVIDEPPALYYLYKYGLENEFKQAFTLFAGQFHRAVKKGRTELLSTVESGFAALDPQRVEALKRKWFGAPLVEPRTLLMLLYTLGGVGAVILLLAFFNFTLRRRVRAKTGELSILMDELAKSEERYRLLFEMESDAILLMTTPEGEILQANQAASHLYGLETDELRGMRVMELSAQPEETARVLLDREESVPLRWHRRKDGTIFPVEITSRHFELGGRLLRLTALRDITERRKTETALRENRKLLENILNSIPQAVFWKDRNSVYLGCNEVFARDAGVDSPAAIVGKNDLELPWDPEDAKAYIADDRAVVVSGTAKPAFVERVVKADGQAAWVETAKVPLVDDNGRVFGVLGVYSDITQRKLHEEQIESSLREKEVLLKEVHHRVKNNLQILSSLINLQAQSLAGKTDTDAFLVMQNRVRSIALVHESIYRSPDLSAVGMKSYLSGLVSQIVNAYRSPGKEINLDLDVADVSLSVDKGIPLGLLVTELVTNALKHAFAPGTPGELKLTLTLGDNICLLTVEDNGHGLPEDFDLDASETLGLKLIATLASQLRGELRVRRGPSPRFEIEFPV